MATIAQGSTAANLPAGLIEHVREEMLQLILANAHVLATRCAECSIHQVWAAACLANAAREVDAALPPASRGEDLCEKGSLPAEERTDPAVVLNHLSRSSPEPLRTGSPEEHAVVSEPSGASAIASEAGICQHADASLPQPVRIEAEERSVVKAQSDDISAEQVDSKAEAKVSNEAASVSEFRDSSLLLPNKQPELPAASVAAEAVTEDSIDLPKEGIGTAKKNDRQFSLDLTPHRKSVQSLLRGAGGVFGIKTEMAARSASFSSGGGRLSLDLTSPRQGASQSVIGPGPPSDLRGLPPMPKVPPPSGEDNWLDNQLPSTFPSHWAMEEDEGVWDAEGSTSASAVENALSACEDDELNAEKELEALRNTILEFSRHLTALGAEADGAAANVAKLGNNSIEGCGGASSSTAPPASALPASLRAPASGPATLEHISRRYARRVSCRAVCIGLNEFPWLHREAASRCASAGADAVQPAGQREALRPPSTSTRVERWTIRLERSSSTPLGIDCARSKEGDILEIREVRPKGMIADWNVAHSQQKLQAGDRIVEVNGQCTRELVLGELKKPGQLAVTLERKVQDPVPVAAEIPEVREEAQGGASLTHSSDIGDFASERRLFDDWLLSSVAAAAGLLDERDRLRNMASAALSA